MKFTDSGLLSALNITTKVMESQTTITNVSFSKLNDTEQLNWLGKGESQGALYALNSVDEEPEILIDDVGEDYYVYNESERDVIVCSDESGESSCVNVFTMSEGKVTEAVDIYKSNGMINHPTIVRHGSDYVLSFINSTASITEDTMKTSHDLYLVCVPNQSHISIESLDYLEEAITPGARTQLAVTLKNNGLCHNTNLTELEVLYGEQRIGKMSLSNCSIGEKKELEMPIEIPNELKKDEKLTVRCLSGNEAQDSESFVVGKSDLAISSERIEGKAIVTVSNESEFDTSAILCVYDTNEHGTELAEYDLGEISGREELQIQYALATFEKKDNLMFVVKSTDAELFEFNNRTTLYVGDDVLKTLDHIEAVKNVVEYNEGEVLSLDDLTVYAAYTDGTTQTISAYKTNADEIDMNTAGQKELIVSYEEVGMMGTASIPITIIANSVFSNDTNTDKDQDKNQDKDQDKEQNIISDTDQYQNTSSNEDTVKNNKKLVLPATPDKVKSVNIAKGVKINWKKVAGANGYLIYRDNKQIKNITNKDILSYTDTGVDNGKKYTYRIYAYKTSGKAAIKSRASSEVTIIYLKAPKLTKAAKTSKKKQLKVTWKKNAKAVGYTIQYSTSKKFTKKTTKSINVKNAKKTSAIIKKLKSGKKYYVRIQAYRKDGKRKYTSAWSNVKSRRI